ncbi:hypothetical protein [Nitrososphaera sp.]|uniref:hypothetical protein n=1 Tax=Nitrososphaera sp. TaxID=1971748 RepID=UPI00307D652B
MKGRDDMARVLERVLESSSRQLDEANKSADELKSVMPVAKGAQERTALNIILDDQKKVAKALERLVSDLSEIIG